MTLADRVHSTPDATALDDGARRRSWGELDLRVRRLARFLREGLGIAPGGHAATLAHNRVECAELMHAAIHAGVWLTPINWHLLEPEIAHVVQDSRAQVVFADAAHAELARAAGAPRVLELGEPLDREVAQASDAPMDPAGPSGGPMIYTSGTTGRPKGVRRARPPRLDAALEQLRRGARAVGLDGSGPHLVTGPCYHAAPGMFAVYDQMNGAPLVIMPRWDEREALALLASREIEHTHLVPTMFVRLLRLPEAERAAFRAPRLHLVLHGAAPISPAVKRQMIAWWGPVLCEYWGGTESGVITCIGSEEWLAHPETVGRALPGYEVFAADEEGRRLPPGEIGMLYARHARTPRMFEYHADPAKTASSYLEGGEGAGAFTLGDIGRVDADGYVALADRSAHTIISGGVNIYPAEIEGVLQQHPAVADVAVFGIPDDEWGEQVKAAVELSAGYAPSPALADELLAFARARLAGYKAPRSIDFEAALPRHPSGKLYVRRLRDRYWQGRERKI
jgi:long-chain acyl-CoA synthetase